MGEQHLALTGIQHRQESHIAQFANARTAEVHVTETDEHTVGLMVAGAPVPAAGMLGGTELYHSEGHISTYEDVTVAAGSYSWIHQFGQVSCLTQRRQQQQ